MQRLRLSVPQAAIQVIAVLRQAGQVDDANTELWLGRHQYRMAKAHPDVKARPYKLSESGIVIGQSKVSSGTLLHEHDSVS